MEHFIYSNCISLASIVFVAILLIWKVFIGIRAKFDVWVNCWFCNENAKIRYELKNNWECPHCGQYNGFTEDGDYNREIIAQKDSDRSFTGTGFCERKQINHADNSPSNGLCKNCNDNQEIKVQKLAEFEPANENTFDEELAHFRDALENNYRLCSPCQKKVKKVLAEKKKMVLGSKLYQFAQGSRPYKQYLKIGSLVIPKKNFYKEINSYFLLILGIFNFVDLITKIDFTKLQFDTSNPTIATTFLTIITHITAFIRVIISYIQIIFEVKIVEKLFLYIRTITILIYYTLGFNINTNRINITSLAFAGIPFGCIFLAFANNILDRFRISRYTFLLTLWSVYAALQNGNDSKLADIFKILASILAIALSFPVADDSQKAKQCLNASTNSFHRIYSKDYLNSDKEDDSIFYDSVSLNNSSFSHSLRGNDSFSGHSIAKPSFQFPSSKRDTTSLDFTSNTSLKSAFQSYINPDNCSLYKSHSFNTSFPLRSQLEHNEQSFRTNDNTLRRNFSEMNNSHCHNMTAINNQIKLQNIIYSTPLSSPLSCSSTITQRQNLLSPSRLNRVPIHQEAYPIQTSWVSGGYFNAQNSNNKTSYFLDNAAQTNENLSRASSQSSGFQSHTSSACNGDRENSFSGEIDTTSSNGLEQQLLMEIHKPALNNYDKLYKTTGRTSTLQLFGGEKAIPNSSTIRLLKLSSQSGNALCNNLRIDCNQHYNTDLPNVQNVSPFDFKTMNNYLPAVEKRCLL